MSVEGDTQRVLASLAAYQERMMLRAQMAMQEVMTALEGWAKSEHSYTDRTGNTTNSIKGQIAEVSAEIVRGVLSAGMDYDVFLELAHEGKWAFLWPTVMNHRDDILAIIERRMNGEGEAT
jgi:hypothetical protein